MTLRQLLATWVAHDLGHIVQVARVMAKQYRDAIGPWHAYLSVMESLMRMTSFYTDLADWWPLFSPPVHYVEEADDLLRRLAPLPPPGTATLLELGAAAAASRRTSSSNSS